MTSELEQEVKQLERAIAEQERKLAAKQAYEESVRESRQRSEVAKAIYKDLNMPMKPIPSNPISRSYVPETFLQDLKLKYLDTKGKSEEAPEQPQSNLALAKELRSMTVDPQRFQESQDAELENMKDTDSQDIWPLLDMDASTLTLEQVRTMGVDKWNKLIYVNALEGNFRNAERVLRLMEEVGVQPDMESFTYLVEAYSNAGWLEQAQATIENMLKRKFIFKDPH
jgi:pentatricopeptide repeat protein